MSAEAVVTAGSWTCVSASVAGASRRKGFDCLEGGGKERKRLGRGTLSSKTSWMEAIVKVSGRNVVLGSLRYRRVVEVVAPGRPWRAAAKGEKKKGTPATAGRDVDDEAEDVLEGLELNGKAPVAG